MHHDVDELTLIGPVHQIGDEDQVARGRDGQEFGGSLNDAENDCFKNAHSFSWLSDLSGNEIYCTTIRLFKGLERPVVILIVPEGSEQSDELLYVGLSPLNSAIKHCPFFSVMKLSTNE